MGHMVTRALATWGVVLAVVWLVGLPASFGQGPMPPQRPRTLIQEGITLNTRGDYYGAAQKYTEAQALQKFLNPREIQNLQELIQQNNQALQLRRDAHAQLLRAEQLLQQGKKTEAGNLLNAVILNQYGDPADRERANYLMQQVQQVQINSQTVQSGTKHRAVGLLEQGRKTYEQGDLQQAEMLAHEAEKAGTWFFWTGNPWKRWPDTPKKLLQDIRWTREHNGILKIESNLPPNIKGPSPSIFRGLFRKDNPPIQEQPLPSGPGGTPAEGPILNPPPPGNSSSSAQPKDKQGSQGTSPLQAVKNMFSWSGGGSGKEPAKTPAADNQSKLGNRPGNPQAQAVPLPPSNPPAANPIDNKQKARDLIRQGYQALQANDYDKAQQLAYQAKELRPDLSWWELNPDRLLSDIQRRFPASANGSANVNANVNANSDPSQVVQTTAKSTLPANEPPKTSAAPTVEPSKTDPRALLARGRSLFAQNKLEEAEKLCANSAAVPGTHWGLFEDSPEKLRVDIQKARSRRDRDESVRLLTEGRKLFAQGRYQEAKNLAWRAQQLHGPYSIWDLGDRPQKLLAEVDRAENNPNKGNPVKTTEPRPADTTPKNPAGQVAGNNPSARVSPNGEPPAGVAPADNEARNRAGVLLVEARDLQKKNMLIEAWQRALAARQAGARFGPHEDSPDLAIRDLAAQCNRQVEFLMQRAVDVAGASGNDPAQFQRAEADLTTARSLAAAFGQDVTRIDQHSGWLRRVQARHGEAATAAVGNPPAPGIGNPPAVGIGEPPPLGPNPGPVAEAPGSAGADAQLGRDKLNSAFLELKAGNTRMARRLVEEVFDAKYGVQQDAAALLRSIDAEEDNQLILANQRNADAGLQAYMRRDYRTARSILASVDVRLLSPQLQNSLREVAASSEMQPQEQSLPDGRGSDVQVAGSPAGPGAAPGRAQAGDLPPGDRPGDLIEDYQAMEEIQFQKLRSQWLEVQAKARDMFGAGKTVQAVELLKDFSDELGRAPLEPNRVDLIRRQIDNRMQQYKTLQAQKVIQGQQDIQLAGWDEGKHQASIQKTQEEVVKLMKQYRTFMKEGKPKEALACARKAKELDPDNVAAGSGEYIASIRINQEEWDRNKDKNADYFRRALSNDQGDFVDVNDPVAFDRNRLDNSKRRAPGGPIWPKTHDPTERAIESKLGTAISLNFKETPLKQVIFDLNTLSGVNIVPDEVALHEASVSLEQPLSLTVENISLKSALNLLLRQVHLTYIVKDQVLLITTEANAKGKCIPVTYAIADLVVPVGDNPLPESSDLTTILEKQMNGNNMAGMGLGLVPGPYALQRGQEVSSGVGGQTQPGMAVANNGQRRFYGQTIEALLIDLIQKTIAPDSWNSVGGLGSIQYFPLGMALIVNQTQDVQGEVYDLLQALRKLQDLEVTIEMRLVSVSEAFFERIGVDFDINIPTRNSAAVQNQLLTSQFSPFGTINRFLPPKMVSGMTPASVFTPDLGIPINATSYGMSIPPFGGYPGTLNGDGGLALGLAFLSDIQVFMLMEAAQGDRRINVMQAPKITVFNGQTAFIQVNDQQFFLLGVQFFPTPFGNIIFNPQQTPIPLGVSLQVTPVVSADRRFVRVNLTPQMTNLSSTNVPLIPLQLPIPTTVLGPGAATTTGPPEALFQMFMQQPTFTNISLSTTVNVPDGGTVLLGGLKTLSEGRLEHGPPILSKIPYLNRLFKNVAYGKEAQSLMIMVTPRIIINEEEEDAFIGSVPPVPRF